MVRRKKPEVLKNDQFGLESYSADRKRELQIIRRIRRAVLTIILVVVTIAAERLDKYISSPLTPEAQAAQGAP